ncbi:MAG: hypothetical protein AAF390_04885 [Pseudomonadota bacterium]
MKTIALITGLAAPITALTCHAEENTKFAPERHAKIAALTAAR